MDNTRGLLPPPSLAKSNPSEFARGMYAGLGLDSYYVPPSVEAERLVFAWDSTRFLVLVYVDDALAKIYPLPRKALDQMIAHVVLMER